MSPETQLGLDPETGEVHFSLGEKRLTLSPGTYEHLRTRGLALPSYSLLKGEEDGNPEALLPGD